MVTSLCSYMHTNFQVNPMLGLPCSCEQISIFFTQINIHNTVDIYKIHSKLGTLIYSPLYCAAKVCGNQATHLHFIVIFAKCAKRNQSPRRPPMA